jgi:hypothetical protein
MRDGELARAAGEQARALVPRITDDATLSDVISSLRFSIIGRLDIEQQRSDEDALLELAERRDDPRGRARALLWRDETSVEAGVGDVLEDLLEEAGRLVTALPDSSYHHAHAFHSASLELIRGDIERADRAIEHAADVGRERGVAESSLQSVRMAQLADVRAAQGRLAELRDEFLPFYRAVGIPAFRGLVVWMSAELGDLDGITDDLAPYVDDFFEHGVRSAIPICSIARMASPIVRVGDRAMAERVYAAVRPYPGHTMTLAPVVSTDTGLGELARFLGREDDARRHFEDAVEFADRLGAPLLRARAEAALATGRSAV